MLDPTLLRRRTLLRAVPALALAGVPAHAASARLPVVMIHGAFSGGWSFEVFAPVFRAKGWEVRTPDLMYHGADKAQGDKLAGVSLTRFTEQMRRYVEALGVVPVLVGHSMGCVIAQQLAAAGLAKALVLVAPAGRAGILPSADFEKGTDQGFMSLGPFWKQAITPDFEGAVESSLNRIPKDRQRAVFDRFGQESGQALFELFFWMIDQGEATKVDTPEVRCPVLVVRGTDDLVVSEGTARATAAAYPGAQHWEEPGHGHMLLVEPGADKIAVKILGWVEKAVG
ncbi:MAG: alpha/beta fold hydrolase [Geminicoccaceae bacterium]